MFQTNNTAQLNSLRLYPKLPATQVGLHEFYITTPLYAKSRLHEIRYIIPYSLCILNKMELSIIFSLLCFYVLSYLVVTPPPPPPFSFSFAEFNTFSILQKPKMGVLILKMKNKTRTHISFYYLVMVQLFATPTIALPYFVAPSLLRLVLTALILLIPYLDFNPSIILYQKACLAPQWSHKTSASIKKWKLQR